MIIPILIEKIFLHHEFISKINVQQILAFLLILYFLVFFYSMQNEPNDDYIYRENLTASRIY